MSIGTFNKIATLTSPAATLDGISKYTQISLNGTTIAEARTAINAATYVFANYDVTELVGAVTGVTLVDASGDALITVTGTTLEVGLVQLTPTITAVGNNLVEGDTLRINFTTASGLVGETGDSLYVDIFTFGDRVNNAIYRLLLEETGDNTATFVGEVEFIMLNQINIYDTTTFSGLSTTSDEIEIIVHEDLTDEDSPRINYMDLGADGVETQIADQVEAPSHSGVVTFDSGNYKTADTVIVMLDDQDINTDSELIDVYVTKSDDKVGNFGQTGTVTPNGDHILDVTFNDQTWTAAAAGYTDGTPHDGLLASGFTLVETGVDSGLFTGSSRFLLLTMTLVH